MIDTLRRLRFAVIRLRVKLQRDLGVWPLRRKGSSHWFGGQR